MFYPWTRLGKPELRLDCPRGAGVPKGNELGWAPSTGHGGTVAPLRPTDAPRRRLGGEYLAHSPAAARVLGAAPLVHGHEQRSPIRAAEDAGETAAVQVDHLEHLAALAHAHAALV